MVSNIIYIHCKISSVEESSINNQGKEKENFIRTQLRIMTQETDSQKNLRTVSPVRSQDSLHKFCFCFKQKAVHFFFFFFFWRWGRWAMQLAGYILVPLPGIEPGLSAVKVQSLNYQELPKWAVLLMLGECFCLWLSSRYSCWWGRFWSMHGVDIS